MQDLTASRLMANGFGCPPVDACLRRHDNVWGDKGPYLRSSNVAVPASSHQLRLRYSVNAQLLIPLLTMPANVALWPPFRGHRPPLRAPRLAVPAPSHQLRLRYLVNSQLLIPLLTMPANVVLWPLCRGHRPPLCVSAP